MIDPILTFFHSLRIQDIFDILIIWIMLSVMLIWFKGRASRFVFIGIGLLGIIYLIARFFQLYLTTVVFQGFFAILLFVLVVIFQEDLRRFFEKLAMWGRFPKKLFEEHPKHHSAEAVALAASNMARKHIGALIVIKGEDPLERHLTGGVPLDGRISQPLLESIFDPHSIGHDGAAVIEGDRVVKFGCHLPLSTNAGRFGSLGLRHTAALGLAERCDALSVVVSEERGTITIAREEQLHELANAAALELEIESFYAKIIPKRENRPVTHWLRENSREKFIAFALACVLWVTFGYQRESIRRDFTVPVEYANIQSEWIIEEPKTNEVRIMLMGPPQAFNLLNANALKISLDLSKIREGWQEIPLSQDMIKKPSGLAVAGITPAQVGITASRRINESLPIQVVTTGRLPAGLYVQQISVAPADIKVLIPRKLQHSAIRIKTEPIDLEKLHTSSSFDVALIQPPDIQFAKGKQPVVRVTIRLKKSGRMDGRL